MNNNIVKESLKMPQKMKDLPVNIEQIPKINVFKVPDGYFEALPDMILSDVKLKSFVPPKDRFIVPDGYFESLSSKILSKVNTKQLYSLDDIPKVNIFKLPNNYFENLEDELFDKSIISTLPNDNIFKVQNGYFDSLPNRIISKIKLKENRGIFEVVRNTKFWVAAASVTILISLGWYFMPQIAKTDVELALDNASTEEIQSYLNTQDLSYIEYENTETETVKTTKVEADSLLFENLKLEDRDILKHIEEQHLDESDIEYILGS